MIRSFAIAPAFLLSVLLAAVALAHGGATGVVKERMDEMGVIAKSMKALGQMMKGDYDAERARALAETIAARGGKDLTTLFPEGSLMKPTEASPKIWSDPDGFAAQAARMRMAAGALAAGADGAQPEALFRALGETCKSCHADYRIKK